MAITKTDVLDTLADARLASIRFRVGPVTVSAAGYRKVAEYIEADAIKIKVGGKGTDPSYFMDSNTLRFPSDSESSNERRATILHECTHALIDIEELHVLRLEGEVAAHLAQYAYLMRLNGNPPFDDSDKAAVADALRRIHASKHPVSVIQVAFIHNLHNAKGFDKTIEHKFVSKLFKDIAGVYADVGDRAWLTDLGVPPTAEMGLRRVLEYAIRRTKSPRPPPRSPFDLPARRRERTLL